MKKEKSSLDRLLMAAAAAPAPRTALDAPSFTLEARVLGQWRRTLGVPEGSEFWWFRRAALAACVLACASLLLSHPAKGNNGGLMAVADSAMGMGVE